MRGRIEVKVVGERVIKAVADARRLGRRDEIFENRELGGDMVAVRRAIGQRRLGLPSQETAAVLGRQHRRLHAHSLEALNPVADVEVRRIEGGDRGTVAAPVWVATVPITRCAARITIMKERRHPEMY